ncbi:MAG: hypothetical protein QG640_206, partial [Patescibacteria group bacterium]|nr:hypothetical protein [Patescibacteria group bacterium]
YGHEVSILSFGEVRHLPKVVRHVNYLFKLLNKAKGVDLIFAQDTVSVGLPALIASRILKKKFFVRVPGDYAWEQSVQRFGVKESIDDFQNKKYGLKVEFLRKLQKITVNGAHSAITQSMYFRELVSKWVKNPEKVFCIYNGIDLSSIPKHSGEIESHTIVSAGRLVAWKGFDVLIRLMKSLPDWKLLIAGDGPLKEELETLAQTEGVGQRVIFPGQIPKKEMIVALQKSELFILNTSFESFSFQVVEAMAAGVPVITTNVGNLAEIVDDGKNGILVAPNDEKAILAAIEKLSHPAFRESVLREALEKAKKFSIENTIKNLLNLINHGKV